MAVKENISYPDFETEINIKLDNITKIADSKRWSNEKIRDEIINQLDRVRIYYQGGHIDYKTYRRLIDLVSEYLEDYGEEGAFSYERLALDLKDIDGWWVYYNTGETYKWDPYNYYENRATTKDTADGIGYDYDDTDEFLLKEYDIVVPEDISGGWSGEYAEFLKDEHGWSILFRDNTYNWAYLGPNDIQFYTVQDPEGDIYTFYEVHQGMDARTGYVGNYVYDYGSELRFDGQQSSDFAYFELYTEDPEGMAASWIPFLEKEREKSSKGYGSGWDEVLEEIADAYYS